MPSQILPSRSSVLLLVLAVLLAASAGVTSADVGKIVEQQGDVATFTITHDGASQADVQIGTDDVNYKVNMTVRGGNDDTITIKMNTYRAGGWNGALPIEVFSASGGDIVRIDRETTALSSPLAPANYGIYVRTKGTLSDRGTVSLRERQTHGLTVLTAPEGPSGESLESIKQKTTERTTITEGDYLVTKIEASGLSGYVEDASDLEQGEEGVSLSLYHERPNADRETITLDETRFSISDDEIYVAFDTKDLDVKAGSNYVLQFEIDGSENPYVPTGQTETVEKDISIGERTIQFTDSEPIIVSSAGGQQIDLSTSVAPGTRFTVTAISSATDDAFRKRDTVEVSADGTLSPTFNFTGASETTEFQISVADEDLTATGYVGRDPNEATSSPTTTATTSSSDTQTETTDSSTGSETTTEDTDSVETTTEKKTTQTPSSPSGNSSETTTGADETQETATTPTDSEANEGGFVPFGLPSNKLLWGGIGVILFGVFVKLVF